MSRFFRDPAFIELLRFWIQSQSGRELPDWNDDLSRIPTELRPHLIIEVCTPAPVYQYVGEACIHRWGEDVTGRRIFGEVLSSVYARYIRSLELEAITRRAPIFSEAIFELGNDMIMTGRLFAPFTRHGSDGASVVFGLQLFNGPPVPLAEISRAGFTSEIQRQMIVAAPGLLAQMEKARHYYQLSRHAHQNELTEMLARISRETIGASLRPLPTFERESVAPE